MTKQNGKNLCLLKNKKEENIQGIHTHAHKRAHLHLFIEAEKKLQVHRTNWQTMGDGKMAQNIHILIPGWHL